MKKHEVFMISYFSSVFYYEISSNKFIKWSVYQESFFTLSSVINMDSI